MWQRTHYRSDKLAFNRLTNLLKQALAKFKTDKYEQYITNLSTNRKSLWTATKRLLSYKQTSHPLRKYDGTWITTDEDKAHLFSQHLTQVFSPHPDIVDNEFTEDVLTKVDIPLPLSPPPKVLTIRHQIHYKVSSYQENIGV